LSFSEESTKNEMLKLFEALVSVMENETEIDEDQIPSRLLFDLYRLTKNNKSKVFNESALWINPDVAKTLLERGEAQKIIGEDQERYALTFRGVSQCIKIKYGKTIEEQFQNFLDLMDETLNTVDQSKLSWKEKLVSLSLILIASTSQASAIKLGIKANKIALKEVFEKVLTCMKKFDIIEKECELKTITRGEDPVCYVMSRVGPLARKTNHYYKFKRDSLYYFDIEKEEGIDDKKFSFLLRRIFGEYNSKCNYKEMYEELAEISQEYWPRFLSRNVNPNNLVAILQKLKEFMCNEIYLK
jgi:hypothetical protein